MEELTPRSEATSGCAASSDELTEQAVLTPRSDATSDRVVTESLEDRIKRRYKLPQVIRFFNVHVAAIAIASTHEALVSVNARA